MTAKTARKLDLGRVWQQTLALIKSHWALLSTISGAFLFLPTAAGLLMFANSDIAWTSKNEALLERQIQAEFIADGWIYALSALLFLAGQLAMYILVLHQKRPTVGQALGLAFVTLPAYLVTYLAIQFALNVAPMATEGMAGVGPIVSGVFFVLSLIVGAHTFVMMPVFASGATLNPLTNFMTSWSMTRGNALSVFALMVLMYVGLLIAGAAIWLMIVLIIGLVSAGSAAVAAVLITLALIVALAQLLIIGVAISVYRQLLDVNATVSDA